MSKHISDDLKSNIVNFYKESPTRTLGDVSKKFNLCFETIAKILKERGVSQWPRHLRNNPNLDESYFEKIDTEAKAYFLGLIIADGNVFEFKSSTRQKMTSISLDDGDRYMLEKFREEVKATRKVSGDGRGCSQIMIPSSKLANDLSKYGVVPRKSFITYLPIIDDSFMPPLIRGILDGDGNITSHYITSQKKHLHSMSFCGTHRLMSELSDYLTEKAELTFKPNVYDYKNRQLSEISIRSVENMERLGNYLYKDSTIYLKRKRDIFDDFLTYYNLPIIPR